MCLLEPNEKNISSVVLMNIAIWNNLREMPNYALRQAWEHKSGTWCVYNVAEEKRERTEIYYYDFPHFHNKLDTRYVLFARLQSRN